MIEWNELDKFFSSQHARQNNAEVAGAKNQQSNHLYLSRNIWSGKGKADEVERTQKKMKVYKQQHQIAHDYNINNEW